MSKIEQVFSRIQETQKELKHLKSSYRDALSNSQRYQNVLEELKGLKEKKQKIEAEIKDDFKSELSRMENLKADIDNDKELLSDIAVSKLARGENIELVDKDQVQYEPIFSVRFKKSK